MRITGYKKSPFLVCDEDKYKKLWGLDKLETIRHLDQSKLLKGIRKRDGAPIILKFNQLREDALAEIAALRWYDGHGCVKLYEADPANGVLLLECVEPAKPLIEFFPNRDEQAVRIAASLMKLLHQRSFAGIGDFLAPTTLLKPLFLSADFPQGQLAPVQSLAREMIQTTKRQHLLHADLHEGNILSSTEHGWVAIDPKGVVGDAALEAAPFICFPLPHRLEKIPGLVSRRLNLFSELLEIERFRIQAWACVFATNMACRMVREEKEVARNWLSLSTFISTL